MDIWNMQKPEYFGYLLNLIRGPDNRVDNYTYLCKCLYDKEFYFTIKEDENRVKWADMLRANYLSTYDRTPDYLPKHGINCLEILISIANEFEKTAYDFRLGQRQWFWFFIFIENLGLDVYTNNGSLFYTNDMIYIGERLDIWMSRKYEPNGANGNIVVVDVGRDLRTINIWSQLQLYYSNVVCKDI